MFCSTIIPTVGRPSLARAVESVLSQQLPGLPFEVIVVNDTVVNDAVVNDAVVNDAPAPLPPAPWQQDERVRIIQTRGHERSVARNTGAAIARGQYLHFLDDDDWLLPGALQRLHALAQQSGAVWVYGAAQLVTRQGEPILVLRPEMDGNCFIQALAGEWTPLQASLIRADAFFANGGFNPLLAGPEDNDILRRIALRHDLASTSEVVATVEWRGATSTTDYDQHPAQSRWAREQILEAPGAFSRMRASADSAYWRGRIARAYATSLVWNLQRRRLLVALSRGVYLAAALLLSIRFWLSPPFWQAVAKPHESRAFRRGEMERGR